MNPAETHPLDVRNSDWGHGRPATESHQQAIQNRIPAELSDQRPQVMGKFLYLRERKLWVRGVTYGPFRSDETGNEFCDSEMVRSDFARMAAHGINAVRTYTTPPRWLLDIAQSYGIFVMVGLPWEQHVAFLDSKKTVVSIESRIRTMIQGIAGHSAILCYVIGNEIPAPIVRWHGRKKVECFLERLYHLTKEVDPNGLVTYVNYPSTEYLQLSFLDFFCFNVYLEEQDQLEAYLYRLQNLAGDRPLIMGELGLDSGRNGEEKQAAVLDWQIRTAFRVGCAGVFVFSWTDEWCRGGHDIEDWHFGLTDRNRFPKPALASVSKAFSEVPFPSDLPWPRISVVVCSYNGAYTIRECFEGLRKLEYPDFEVVVVNDGSTDTTAAIAAQYGFRVICTGNNGLSTARNVGMRAADGEIIAYIDDDAYPDPDWLKYVAVTFLSTDCAGVGGPNAPPPGAGEVAECVANAPGGPLHVLISDREAEHIPGCNMAIRKERLEAIGGFDPRFRTAGDDVDLCWRLQERGWWLAFSPGAMVWHHRRNSVRAYWRQQKGYGRAEALLAQKWPGRYNPLGHLTWVGRIYGKGLTERFSWRKPRIYHGSWGRALFQSVYERRAGTLESLPLMPEWYMVNFALLLLSASGIAWKPMLFALPLLVVTSGAPFAHVLKTVAVASFPSKPASRAGRLKLRLLTGLLHVLQPLARLYGRLRHGLTPWRRPNARRFAFPRNRNHRLWSKQWRPPEERLEAVEKAIEAQGATVCRGGNYDRWDLEVRGGWVGLVRLYTVVEEHGEGRQLMRLLVRPRLSTSGTVLIFLFATFFIGACIDQVWTACAIFGSGVFFLALRALQECGGATAAVLDSLQQTEEEET